MPRLFIRTEQIRDGRCALVGADAAHLARSLRVRPGELLQVVDDTGVEHGLRVDAVSRERVEGVVAWSRPAAAEAPPWIDVLQALLKSGIDEVVDTLIQAGASAIHPFVAERSVARPDAERAARRLERWRTIAREAAQQSMRGAVPEVHPAATLDQSLARLPAGCPVLIASPGAARHIATLSPRDRVAVVIGPEGGLSPAETSLLEAHGATPVHLGPRVLRSRLAGTVAVALLRAAVERVGPATPAAEVSPAGPPGSS